MLKILIDRIELFLKSIPKSKFLTFFGLSVNSALLQRASFIFPHQIEPSAHPGPVLKNFRSKKFLFKIIVSPLVITDESEKLMTLLSKLGNSLKWWKSILSNKPNLVNRGSNRPTMTRVVTLTGAKTQANIRIMTLI